MKKTHKYRYKKRIKRTIKRKNKKRGGSNPNIDNEKAKRILENIQENRKIENAQTIEQMKQTVNSTINLINGSIENAIVNIGNKIGVDITNPENIQRNLEKIKEALNDPETREKMKEIIYDTSIYLGVIMESAQPFTKPLVDTGMKALTEASSKVGESAVKIVLNTAEEIPIIGILIGSVRSISNVGEAIIASIGAGSKVVTSFSDTVNATFENVKDKLENLSEEKRKSIDRINNSTKRFIDSYKT